MATFSKALPTLFAFLSTLTKLPQLMLLKVLVAAEKAMYKEIKLSAYTNPQELVVLFQRVFSHTFHPNLRPRPKFSG